MLLYTDSYGCNVHSTMTNKFCSSVRCIFILYEWPQAIMNSYGSIIYLFLVRVCFI